MHGALRNGFSKFMKPLLRETNKKDFSTELQDIIDV
jgi:hypothetical protein